MASDGVRLAAREWPGRSRPILLLHGLASTSHIFDLLAPRLAGRHRVVAYDQRGHGESGKPSGGYGFARTAADALAVRRRFGLRRPLVLGHSWGANVALELAVRRPDAVGGLVLLDGGFLTMRGRLSWREAREMLAPPPLAGLSLGRFLAMGREQLRGVLRWSPPLERILQSYVRVDARRRIRPRLSRANHMRILRAMWEQDPMALLHRVRVPTLVLACRSTNVGDAEFVQAKRAAAPAVRAIGPPVRFAWIEAVHDVPLQRPAALAARIRAFARTL